MINEYTPQSTTALTVLRQIIAAPGILAARDFVTGDRYPLILPVDLGDFLDAHTQGPGRRRNPPRFAVTDDQGTREIESFVRPEVLPVGSDGHCTHVAVSVRTRNAAEPDEGLLAAAIIHRERGARVYMERSVLTGVWNLWLVLAPAVERQHAERFAQEVRRTLGIVGSPSMVYEIPLLDGRPTATILLPCPFYHAGYLGVLFEVSSDARLVPLPIDCKRGSNANESSAASRSNRECSRAAEHDDSELEALLSAWCARSISRPVRTGQIIQALACASALPEYLARLAPSSAAILLGRQLIEYAARRDGRFSVAPMRSGHSHRFCIEKTRNAKA